MTARRRQTALITGAARRIGAHIASRLHAHGMNVIVHCHQSQQAAQALLAKLNQQRANSAQLIQADLSELSGIDNVAKASIERWGRLDVLINNASAFISCELNNLDEQHWDNIMNTNLKAPLFLSRALAAELQRNHGCIINLSDIHAQRPLKNFLLYCISKAGLDMLTKALARELAPAVRCNAVAPGAIEWPPNISNTSKQAIIKKIALRRSGSATQLAQTVLFLIQSEYITGQIINVDGGRTLSQ